MIDYIKLANEINKQPDIVISLSKTDKQTYDISEVSVMISVAASLAIEGVLKDMSDNFRCHPMMIEIYNSKVKVEIDKE